MQACYELAVLGEDDPRPPPAQLWYAAMLKAIDGRAAIRCFAEGNSAIAARVAVLDDVVRAAAPRTRRGPGPGTQRAAAP